jgi:catechol 2,3-dioxygenase-like lactoylglutathione lyase family enzyme
MSIAEWCRVRIPLGAAWSFALMLASAPSAPRAIPEAAVTGLDHVPIAVNDLEAASRRYRELGFALKPGTVHTNGIRNQHVKFPDGTELELITAPEARDPLTTKYRRHLAAGEGPAFLALFAPSRDRAAQRLEMAKIGHRRTPGYVAVADPHPLDYIFFAGRNHSPTDRPEHFAHGNGAESLIEVWLAGADLSRERALLEDMGASLTTEQVRVPDTVNAEVARFMEGAVVLLPGDRQLVAGRPIVGAVLRVPSLAVARKAAAAVATAVSTTTTSIFVPPSSTHGIWLELREAR